MLRFGQAMKILPGLAVFALAVVAAYPSRAEPPGGSDRKNQLGLYFWVPALDGSTTLGNVVLPIDSSLDDFDVGGPIGYVRTPEPWGALVTTVFMEIDSDFATTMPSLSGTQTVEFFMTDAVANRRWGFKNDRVGVELLFGARYWRLEQRRTFMSSPEREESADWGDGVLGGRVTIQMAKNWWFIGRLDGAVGESDRSWNTEATFQWRATRLFSLMFGYRLVNVEYETGSASSRFALDTDIGGPAFAFLFSF